MLPVAVQIVERLASNREDHLTDVVGTVMGTVNGKRVPCTQQPVPVVEKKPAFPFNLAKIAQFTVAIVINHARLSAQTLVDLVGKRDVPDYCQS
jgi:hypothetical protein